MIVGCFFFKQKTAYEMRISDWSSDVCSSDLAEEQVQDEQVQEEQVMRKLFVRGLANEATQESIWEYFEPYGNVTSAQGACCVFGSSQQSCVLVVNPGDRKSVV